MAFRAPPGERVFSKMHWGCAGMISAAVKADFQTALANDGIDHSERQVEGFEHRTLFDAKFHVGGGFLREPRPGNPQWVSPRCKR